MSEHLGNKPRCLLAAGLFAGLVCAGVAPASAQQGPPEFSAVNVGWISVGGADGNKSGFLSGAARTIEI